MTDGAGSLLLIGEIAFELTIADVSVQGDHGLSIAVLIDEAKGRAHVVWLLVLLQVDLLSEVLSIVVVHQE